MADNTIEIVIKADGTQAIANINKIRAAITEVDQKASTGKVREEFAQLQKVGALVQRELTSSFKTIGITGSLLSGGLVAGLVMAGKSLADFGRQGLQLHHLSRELGVGAESLMRWRLAGQAAGLTSEQAASDVQGAMRKLQELGRRGGYSELYRELAESTADLTGRNLAQALYAEVRAGGPEQGFRFLLQKLQEYAKSGNRWGVTTVSNILSLSPGWEHSIDLIDKIGKVYVVSEEKAARYQLSVVLLGQQLTNLQTEIGSELLPVFTEMADSLRSWLETPEGKKFQADLVKLAKDLQDLPWKDIREGAEATVKFVSTVFVEGTKVIQAFIWTFQQGIDAYNKLKAWNREKLREERLGGLHGRAAQEEEMRRHQAPGGGRLAPGPYGGRTAGVPGLPGSPSGPAGPRTERNPSYDLSPDQIERLKKRGGRRATGPALQLIGASGGEADGHTEFASLNRRQQSTEDLNDQMRDVTDEVRRLNDLLRGGGDVARIPGGGAGGMGPTGGGRGGGGGGGGDGRSPSNPQDPPSTTSSPQTARPPIPGPGGRPMPPWGTTTAEFGGGAGGGAAGGVPGAAGGPSGRTLTPEERKAQAGAGAGADTPEGAGGGQEWLKDQRARLTKELNDDPALKDWLMRVASYEEPGRAGTRRVVESLFNRALDRGTTLRHELRIFDKSFYGPIRAGQPQRGYKAGSDREAISRGVDDVTKGSNDVQMSTDQGSPGEVPVAPRTYGSREHYGSFDRPGERRRVTRQEEYERRQRERPPQTTTAQPSSNPQAPPPVSSNPQGPPDASSPQEGGGISFGTKIFGPRAGKPGSGEMPPQYLQNIMEYAGRAAGVNTEIFAGIEGGHHRHLLRQSGGIGSADIKLRDPRTGEILNSDTPEGRAKIAAYIEAAAAAGATGIGHARDYMTAAGIHIGGGKEAVWGSKGRGPGAPDWVREAFNRGRKRAMTPQQLALELKKQRDAAQLAQTQQSPKPNNTAQQNPQSSIPLIHQPRQGVPVTPPRVAGVGGDAARDAKIAKMREDAGGEQSSKKADDAEADRKVVDSSLVNQVEKQSVSGKATIDVVVKNDQKEVNTDANLFNTTRSKSAPQMPNSPSEGDGDHNSGSNEDK